jgi:hypothetical protein
MKDNFNNRFNNINFILNEESIRSIKSSTFGNFNNCNIEEIWESLKNINDDAIVNVYPINAIYNNNDQKQERNQEIILLGNKK